MYYYFFNLFYLQKAETDNFYALVILSFVGIIPN